MPAEKLFSPRQAAQVLGVSYPTLKTWIYKKKIRTIKTAGGHHRIPESQLDKFLHQANERGDVLNQAHRLPAYQRTQSADRSRDGHQNQRLDRAGQPVHRRPAHHFHHHRRRSSRNAPQSRRQSAALIKSTEVMILRA